MWRLTRFSVSSVVASSTHVFTCAVGARHISERASSASQRLPEAASPAASSASAPSDAQLEAKRSPPPPHGGSALTLSGGPLRRVGNIFIVRCVDHPFKFAWEVNRMLRELRLEFMGQTTIVPDIPAVRRRLWRVRHVVRVDQLDLDEAKALIGVPEHITFGDLNAQIPATFGRIRGFRDPHMRSKANFMRLRRMRLRDVLHRDEIEKRLLEERRSALRALQQPQPSAEHAP